MLYLLFETGKLGVKTCSSAIGVHLIREGETFEDPERCKRLVGKLNYLAVTLVLILPTQSVL